MTSDVLSALIRANLAASVAILAVLAARGPIRRQFGARLAYAAWLAVPLAGLAVFIPKPAVVVPLPAAPLRLVADQAVALLTLPGAPTIAPESSHWLIQNVPALLIELWIAGAVVMLGMALRAHRRGVATFGVLSDAGNSRGVLRASNEGLGPALIGLFTPRLVLPADFETRFEVREQELILAHESSHLATGDTRVNTAIILASCLNWFNPLVHVAAFHARVDQELACDAAVVGRFPGERRTYAEALLKTQLASAPLPLGCYWPGGSSRLLKERLEMLALAAPGRHRLTAGIAVVIAASLGAGLAAWSAQAPGVRIAQASPPSRPVPPGPPAGSPSAQGAIGAALSAPAQAKVVTPPAPSTTRPGAGGGVSPGAANPQMAEALASGNTRLALDLGASAADIAAAMEARNPDLGIDVDTARFIRGPGGGFALGYITSRGRGFTTFSNLGNYAPPGGLEGLGGLSSIPGAAAALVPPAPRPEIMALGQMAQAGQSAQDVAAAYVAGPGQSDSVPLDPASARFTRNSDGSLGLSMNVQGGGGTRILQLPGTQGYAGPNAPAAAALSVPTGTAIGVGAK